jgi:folate-binding protein YgfZ
MQVCELRQYEYVLIAGPDSITFLQGQVTCDMTQLTDEQCLAGALCNLKGRVIGDFLCMRSAEGCLLQISEGNGQKIAETLAKYAVFSNAEVAIHSGPCRSFGILANECPVLHELLPAPPTLPYQTATSRSATMIKLAGTPDRFQLWVWDAENADLIAESLRRLTDQQTLADSRHYDYAETLAGRAHVSAQHSEAFTPQLLNYDLSGVVNFQKGCYTGQEVVARMHYRAEAKKRLFLLLADSSSDALNDGADLALVQQDQQITAQIVDRSCGPGNSVAMLVILPTACANSEESLLLEQDPKVGLTVSELNYT